MKEQIAVKPVVWVASTKKDLSVFPQEARNLIGEALYRAQIGKMSDIAKPMKGTLRGVTEIVAELADATFRLCYTAKIGDQVYAIHAFQKKSKSGITTPKKELALIAQRFKEARRLAESRA